MGERGHCAPTAARRLGSTPCHPNPTTRDRRPAPTPTPMNNPGQPGRHVHGYGEDDCYLPLYIHCGEHVLCAKLRPRNIDACRGALAEVKRIVGHIREH